MKKNMLFLLLSLMAHCSIFAQLSSDTVSPVVRISNGTLQGINVSGIRTFKGIPYAAPPVGNLRWREPQPVASWVGVRKAEHFGPRAMQLPVFSDMNFHSNGVSEDCLYLNVWTPAKSAGDKLPVLVYFYGGGFIAGDGSEPRYAGESMARNGIVAITVNYRLTIFGFFAHPELTKESPHHASGNYGLLDQAAALRWVQQNIAAFGGDPTKVTIAGESAGSFAVSAQMASPLSRNLIAGAIGESGSLLGLQPPASLSEAEKLGTQFAASVGAASLADLRAMPADQVLQATSKPGATRFPVTVDGYFFPKSPAQIYASGQQAHVPLLVGWNSEENNYKSILGNDETTKDNFMKAVQKLYPDKSAEALKAYSVSGDDEVVQVATELASDRFIGFGTWKWSDIQSKTGGKPVYRYLYERPRPSLRSETGAMVPDAKDSSSLSIRTFVNKGASHSAEIEYALGNLPTNRVFDWQPDDYQVSEILQAYFVNFIKTGNPNGLGVPLWPAVSASGNVPVMHVDVHTRAEPEKNRQHYLFMESMVK